MFKKMCWMLFFPSFGFAIQPGFYGDMNVGVSSGPTSVVASGMDFKGSGGTVTTAARDFFGLNNRGAFSAFFDVGYNIIPNLGVEANYTYWGEQSLSNYLALVTTATGGMDGLIYTQSVGGNVVLYLPVDQEKFNFYAKLGAAALYSTFKINDPNGDIFFKPGAYSDTGSSSGLTYGLGVQYQLNPHMSLLLAWNGISQFNDTPISNIHYHMGSIGFRYTFPKQAPMAYQK